MTRSRVFGAVCLIVFGVASLVLEVRAQGPTHAAPRPDTVEAFLRRQMQTRGIPGLQVAVVQRGKIVLLGAYGLANVEHAVPVTDQTVFPVNSITKAFTGVAIMQLVEAGNLELAAPVSRYLDGMPAAWRDVTIRQLLTHTSGIPNIMDDDAKLVAEGGEDAAWAKVQRMPMEFAPGERFHYNQTNYLLLGRIIDKLSGRPFARFITERQFDVVGMTRTARTGFVDSHDVVPNSARTYTLVGPGRLGHVFEEFPPSLRTAAGINSTAEEMARWVVALRQGRLLEEKSSVTTLWTPGVLSDGTRGGFGSLLNGYALGWPTMTRPEHRAVGGVGGGRSAFFVYPDDDLAVVILTNLRGASPESFVDEVAGYYIPTMRATTGFGVPRAITAPRAELMRRGRRNPDRRESPDHEAFAVVGGQRVTRRARTLARFRRRVERAVCPMAPEDAQFARFRRGVVG